MSFSNISSKLSNTSLVGKEQIKKESKYIYMRRTKGVGSVIKHVVQWFTFYFILNFFCEF
jgi:hypothetical protein